MCDEMWSMLHLIIVVFFAEKRFWFFFMKINKIIVEVAWCLWPSHPKELFSRIICLMKFRMLDPNVMCHYDAWSSDNENLKFLKEFFSSNSGPGVYGKFHFVDFFIDFFHEMNDKINQFISIHRLHMEIGY